jgi:endonuclease III
MDRVPKVIELLKKNYPKSKLTLNFKNPLELLVATMLAAQYRDVMVDKITETLFAKYKTAEDFSKADYSDLLSYIRSATFAAAKAKNIINTCKIILEKYYGTVPKTMDELVELPGVGRKTANVVLSNAYGIIVGMEVDRHNARVSYRLGFTKNTDPVKIEQDLMKIIPKGQWLEYSHMIKDHGRAICKNPVPVCSKCFLNETCPKNGVTKKM